MFIITILNYISVPMLWALLEELLIPTSEMPISKTTDREERLRLHSLLDLDIITLNTGG